MLKHRVFDLWTNRNRSDMMCAKSCKVTKFTSEVHTMKNDVLFLTTEFKYRLWGGTRLEQIYNQKLPYDKTGEAWCISAHPNGPSKIINGTYQGLTLTELYKTNRELFGNITNDEFPLLIKIIDANDDLSVQVHPDDLLAKKYQSLGKTECWYILDASEDAYIIFGHKALTKDEFIAYVNAGKWDELLYKVPVKTGDFFYIPAGILHALGKGILVLETQQSSDITYRLYDYDRKDSNGLPRELHLDAGIEATLIPSPNSNTNPHTFKVDQNQITRLIESSFFTVDKWELTEQMTLTNPLFKLITFVEGSGTINGYPYKKGHSCIVTSTTKLIDMNPLEPTLIISSHILDNEPDILFLGIDGGGTKTKVAIIDEQKNLIYEGLSGPSSIDTVNNKTTLKALQDALNPFFEKHPNTILKACFAGLGGVSKESHKELLRNLLTLIPGVTNKTKVTAGSDMENALASGLFEDEGMVLIVGTGSVAYGRNKKGETHKAGGLGYKEGDAGSAYDLGLKAIQASARALDYRYDMTPFTKEVIDTLKFKEPNDVIDFMEENRENRTLVASLAPIVTKHADLGDEYARNICDSAINELVLSVLAVNRKLRLTKHELVIVGALGNSHSYFKYILHLRLIRMITSIRIVEPSIDSAFGASLLSYRTKALGISIINT